MRKFKAVLATILACLVLAGCSVLPEEDAPEKEPEKEAPTSTVMEVPEREASEEDVRSAYISEFKLRYLFNMLIKLPPIPTNAELEQMRIEREQSMPYKEPAEELVRYCRNQADKAVQDFLADYSSEAYEDNEENRTLKKIYDGVTGREINGGLEAMTIGYETGYWRVTDCSYYNSAFFTNGDHNSIRLLYRCSMFHYVLNSKENLAQSTDTSELTTGNSTVNAYDNAFLVVTMTDITPNDVGDDLGRPVGFEEKVLLFTDYDAAIASFSTPQHTFKELYLPKGSEGSIVNGYKGEPLVFMPDLSDKYIDVSRPENVRELDELGITNYTVKWVENDGSYIPYSILSCSVAPDTIVDITDMSRESNIIVEVADRAVAPAPTPEPEPEEQGETEQPSEAAEGGEEQPAA